MSAWLFVLQHCCCFFNVFIGYMSLDFLLYWASLEANFNVVLALAESSSCDMFLEQREDLKQSMFQLR